MKDYPSKTTNNFYHVPVLLDEAILHLNIKPGGRYIDATAGGGGHLIEILNKGGIVLALDQDEDAVTHIVKSFKKRMDGRQLIIVNNNFSNLQKVAKKENFVDVDGILFDLGLSSHQIDYSKRGFSFLRDEELDMRMDTKNSLSAYDVVNYYPEEKLSEIFLTYGEEHNAHEIARSIVNQRKIKKLETTKELSQLIEKIGGKSSNINPSTKIFQAVRIEVNGEIDVLKKGLFESFLLLKPAGRLVVISFHSLEDRVVKLFFEKMENTRRGKIITKKPILATENEIKLNRRSRSAKMRVLEKK